MNFTSRILVFSSVFIAMLILGGCASRPFDRETATLQQRFQRADQNRDGKVSRDEFTDLMISDAFALYDKDGDGMVTLAEFTAGGGTPETFRSLDRTGKGSITLEQAKASKRLRDQLARVFSEADADGSGYVTFEEYVSHRQSIAPYVR